MLEIRSEKEQQKLKWGSHDARALSLNQEHCLLRSSTFLLFAFDIMGMIMDKTSTISLSSQFLKGNAFNVQNKMN